MSNFGLLIRALPGILLSIAILAVVVVLVVKVLTGRWPSIQLLSGDKTTEKPIPKSNIK